MDDYITAHDASPSHDERYSDDLESTDQQIITRIADAAVSRAITQLETLFEEQTRKAEARDVAAATARRARVKKERKERENERKDLVEAIREMVLEERMKDEVVIEEQKPVVLKDAVGRKFVVPWDKAKEWTAFEYLIKEAFLHIEILSHHVNSGFYDILSPKGHIILPCLWNDIVEPGWEVSMHMWPKPEANPPLPPADWERGLYVPSPPPPPRRTYRDDSGSEDDEYVRKGSEVRAKGKKEKKKGKGVYRPGQPLKEIVEEVVEVIEERPLQDSICSVLSSDSEYEYEEHGEDLIRKRKDGKDCDEEARVESGEGGKALDEKTCQEWDVVEDDD